MRRLHPRKSANPDRVHGRPSTCLRESLYRAFVHTGVDYADPVSIRATKGHKSYKGYISVFICMTNKAIHLELVNAYFTSAFLAAFHRFRSRRGLPTTVYSDNGTTFQGADCELRLAVKSANEDQDFINQLSSEGVT